MAILVCGASGRTSGFVIDALLDRSKAPLRLLVHRHNTIEALQGKFPTESIDYVVGDNLDRKSLMAAMQGVDIVFYNSPPLDAQETAMGISVVQAAQASNVKHFVYASVLHPLRTKLMNHKVKLPVEEYLIESRLNYTILQPTHFMQNIPVPTILSSSSPQVSVPYSPHELQGFVDLKDFGEVAASVLLNPEPHNRARYEMVGDNKSYDDAAKALSQVIGRDVPCVQISLDQAVKMFQARGACMDEWGEDAARRLFFYYDRWGLTGNSNVLTWLLGRKPTDVMGYITEEVNQLRSRSKE